MRLSVCIILLLSAIHGQASAEDSKERRRAAHRARMEKKARTLAAGHLPCSSSSMEVEDLETTWTTMAYTIHCNGKTYRCSVQGPVMVPITQCFRIDGEDAPVTPSPPSTRVVQPPPPQLGETILVFPIEDSTDRIAAEVIENLTDHMGIQLARAGRYRLVPREQLRDRLREESKGSYRACFDEACQIELGKELAAEKIASARVYRAGSTCILSIAIFDLTTAASEKAASSRSDCSAEALFTSVESVTEELRSVPAARVESDQTRPIAFTSDPPGASVFVDDELVCSTPCQHWLTEGLHEIRMHKLGHVIARRSVSVDQRTPPITMRLVKPEPVEYQ